jgi:hypothetical protein
LRPKGFLMKKRHIWSRWLRPWLLAAILEWNTSLAWPGKKEFPMMKLERCSWT